MEPNNQATQEQELSAEESMMTLLAVIEAAVVAAFEKGFDPTVSSVSFDLSSEDGNVKITSIPVDGEASEIEIPSAQIEQQLMSEEE